MKPGRSKLSLLYQAALRAYLKEDGKAGLESARGLGGQALAAGMQTLELAKLHEKTLVTELLPDCASGKRAGLIKQAGAFFAMAITPIENEHRSTQQATAHLKRFIETLSQRTVKLAASNLELSLEIAQRKSAEAALKKSERHYSRLLEQSESLQEQLRQLSRQILSAQEEERKKISRELHDVIAQTLTGINVRLATLKREAAHNVAGLERNIDRTRRLVEKSVHIVHQFARELRPAVLDDLGLIPALQTCLKSFSERSGIRSRFTACPEVEKLDISKRTALFRVAQEAILNVGRHAKARRVHVTIQSRDGGISLSIKDNGRGFLADRVWRTRRQRRLGLLGMRERMEMIGGTFTIVSSPGKGATVEAWIPPAKEVGRNASPAVPEPKR